ncbi:MAG: STAS domain-containing protein [bacterium]
MDETRTEKNPKLTPFSVEFNRDEDLAIFKLYGDLEVNGAQSLRNKFASNVLDKDRFLVFDASEMPYLNSTGIGAFLAFLKHAQDRDGKLIILNAHNKVKNIFKIASLDQYILFLESLDDARNVVAGENPDTDQED